MPDFIKKPTGEIDYSKFFMSIAVAVVFVLQAWSQMQHTQAKEAIKKLDKVVVPRPELTNTLHYRKENTQFILNDIDKRLTAIEEHHQELDKVLEND